MATIFDFMKCEVCGKEFSSVQERKSTVDRQGFTHTFCLECYRKGHNGGKL